MNGASDNTSDINNNIIMVKSSVTASMRESFQKWFTPTKQQAVKLLVDDGAVIVVKRSFKEDGVGTECMWVLIDQVDIVNKHIIGTLDNQPAYISNVQLYDNVIVMFNDIIDFAMAGVRSNKMRRYV